MEALAGELLQRFTFVEDPRFCVQLKRSVLLVFTASACVRNDSSVLPGGHRRAKITSITPFTLTGSGYCYRRIGMRWKAARNRKRSGVVRRNEIGTIKIPPLGIRTGAVTNSRTHVGRQSHSAYLRNIASESYRKRRSKRCCRIARDRSAVRCARSLRKGRPTRVAPTVRDTVFDSMSAGRGLCYAGSGRKPPEADSHRAGLELADLAVRVGASASPIYEVPAPQSLLVLARRSRNTEMCTIRLGQIPGAWLTSMCSRAAVIAAAEREQIERVHHLKGAVAQIFPRPEHICVRRFLFGKFEISRGQHFVRCEVRTLSMS